MITYSTILGSAAQEQHAQQLHALEHENRVDYVMLSSDDIQRRRLKVITQQGHDCGIALARDQQLFGGAILSLSEEYALVVRCTDVQWLRCQPVDAAAALELGYFAGNMHWAVRFAGQVLEIEIKGRLEDYRQRLQPLLSRHAIRILSAPSTLHQDQNPGQNQVKNQHPDHVQDPAHEYSSHQH